MTSLENVSASLHLALALSLLLVLASYFWRQYRVDRLRETLFKLRAELFDYAASGQISFADPAYTKLRVMMNGMIRFAHKFTFSRIALVILFRKQLERLSTRDHLAEWQEALVDLPEKAQERLREINDKMVVAIVWHSTTGSPILLAAVIFMFVRSNLSGQVKKLDEVSAQLPGVDVVQRQTLNAELDGRQECTYNEPTLAHS